VRLGFWTLGWLVWLFSDPVSFLHALTLFLNGTRDELAVIGLLRPVCERLGDRAKLHALDTADHG
jgi:hypothetical protein